MCRFNLLIYFSLYTTLAYGEVYNGLILYSNSQGVGPSNTYIIDNNYNFINIWDHSIAAIGIPYLNSDGTIIQQFKSDNHYFGNSHGPIGGVFRKTDWHGTGTALTADVRWQSFPCLMFPPDRSHNQLTASGGFK